MSKHVELQGLTLTSLDTRYLRLDCSNDPLTESLTIQKAGDNIHYYADVYSTNTADYGRLYFRKVHSNTAGNMVATQNNEWLGNIKYLGVNNVGVFAGGGQMTVQQVGAVGGFVPTRMKWTTYNTTGENADQFILNADGSVYVGTGFDFGIGATKWNSGDNIDGATIAANTIDDLAIDWGTEANQVSADDIPDGATNAIITLTQETNFGTAYTHIGESGASHTHIDQSVISGSSPTFDGANFTGIPLVDKTGITLDGGGGVITTGIKGDIEIPYACTINSVTLLADQSGSIVVDIWKDTYANFPPTNEDTITASSPPTISSATKSQDSTLTQWITSLSDGDILRYNVDSCTDITRCTLILKVIKR